MLHLEVSHNSGSDRLAVVCVGHAEIQCPGDRESCMKDSWEALQALQVKDLILLELVIQKHYSRI